MRDERARHAAARRALVRVSRYAGARADLVQAGGGNTSVKTPDGIMYTKASGIALDRVTTRTGAAAVRLDGVRGADGPTAATLARWQAACAVGPVRPSIEVALHAVLDTVVLHTHPVAINAFVCARRGIAHARRLLRPWAPLVIPYRLPGIALAALLARALAGAPAPRAGARVVLLASHGLVVSGPSVAAVIDTNEAVVRTLADAVGRPAPAPPPMDRGALGKIVAAVRAAQPGLPYVAVAPALPAPPRAASTPAVLFPDAAVYCGATALPLPDGARPAALRAAAARYARRWRQAPRVWRAGDVALCAGVTASAARATADVFWAHEQVRALTAAPGLGGPRWLGTAAVRALLGWEAEAYRQQVAARAPR